MATATIAGLLIAALVAAHANDASADPRKLTLDVTPTSGTMSDVFTVTVRVEVAGVGGPERYWKPSFPNFEVVSAKKHPGQFLSSDPTQPKLVSSDLYVYQLRPKRVGRLMITAARIRLRGRDYRTQRTSVLVSPGTATAAIDSGSLDPLASSGMRAPGFEPPRVDGAPPFFIHTVADKRAPFVGEQVVVTWLLYSTKEVLKYTSTPPRLDSLWSEVLFETGSHFRYFDAQVNGEKYYVTPLAKHAMFPTRAGRVTVRPLVADVAILDSPNGRTSRIKSPPIVLQVAPLPGDAPPGFDPTYVGIFEIEAELDRTAIDADEALTLQLTVSGEGALRRTSPPKLSFPGFDFRVPRDFEESIDTTTDIVRGNRVYRYWTTPEKGGPQELPAIQLHYFNPRTKRYEVTATQRIPIVVRGEPTAVGTGEGGGRRIDRDIRLMREGKTIESRSLARWYSRTWFWVLCALPLLAFITVESTDRVRQRLRRETPRARLRRARGKARQHFRVAEIHLRGNRPAKFFGELVRILYDTLEERVNNPVQSMTRDELAEYLRERSFAQNTIKRILADLDAFDMARFAPSTTATEDMRAALRRVKGLLREIERTQVSDTETDDEADA